MPAMIDADDNYPFSVTCSDSLIPSGLANMPAAGPGLLEPVEVLNQLDEEFAAAGGCLYSATGAIQKQTIFKCRCLGLLAWEEARGRKGRRDGLRLGLFRRIQI
jgi:hypothetical protein